jgi:hypothetical protein
MKGAWLFMVNNKLILVAALAVIAVGMVSLGASQLQGVRVPPGPIVVSPNAGVGLPKPLVVPDAPALPEVAQASFQDDFSGELGQWQTVQTAPATWVVRDGRLRPFGDANGVPSEEPSVLAIKGLSMSDGKVEAHVFPTSGDPVGLVFRGSDAGYYRLDLYPNLPNKYGKAILNSVTSKGVERLVETPVSTWPGYKYNQWQLVTVTLAGTSITASLDGAQVLTANDSSFNAGWAGVWTVANTGAQFDNVRIQQANSR